MTPLTATVHGSTNSRGARLEISETKVVTNDTPAAVYHDDAGKVIQILQATLPSGTLDRVLEYFLRDLVREVPEAQKPRTIAIKGGKTTNSVNAPTAQAA